MDGSISAATDNLNIGPYENLCVYVCSSSVSLVSFVYHYKQNVIRSRTPRLCGLEIRVRLSSRFEPLHDRHDVPLRLLICTDRIVEVQIFLSALIRSFEFRATKRTKAVRRENCLAMLPMVEGEEAKGNQMPVEVRMVKARR